MGSGLRRVVPLACAVVLAAAFVLAGASKLSGPSAARWSERFARWGFPARAHYVVGVLEILGGLGLLVPRTRRVAAATLIVIMIGALSTHLVNGEAPRVVPPLVLGGLAIAVYRWRGPGPAVVHPSRDG
jgi:putative oxidoreductase